MARWGAGGGGWARRRGWFSCARALVGVGWRGRRLWGWRAWGGWGRAATASVARLRQQDEDLKRENGRLQQEAAYRARAMVEKVRGLAEAKMAVRNLACRCSRDNRAYGGDASLSRELDFVEERARVLREIAHAATSDVA